MSIHQTFPEITHSILALEQFLFDEKQFNGICEIIKQLAIPYASNIL
jgi:hypothetical protein